MRGSQDNGYNWQTYSYSLDTIITIKHSQQVEGGDAPPQLCPDETLPGVLCPALGSSPQETPGALGTGPEEGHKNDRGMEHLSYEDRLRELGLSPGRPYCSLSVLKEGL